VVGEWVLEWWCGNEGVWPRDVALYMLSRLAMTVVALASIDVVIFWRCMLLWDGCPLNASWVISR
jgi:hypothetical protein